MKSIIDCGTGEITKIDLDKVSKDQQKIDEADFDASEIIRKAEAKAKADAKTALLDRLGITAEEATLLLS
jgi:vacuolar-type H+-ATPase subunit H